MSTLHSVRYPCDLKLASTVMPLRILVGSAGGPSSMGAIRMASALAAKANADIHIMAVATPLPYVFAMDTDGAAPIMVDEDNRLDTLGSVRRQLEDVPEADQWRLHAVVGLPAESILDEAKHWGASLIVIGVARHHFLNRVAGTETAVAIASRSTVPVMAVPVEAVGLPTRVLVAIDFSESSTSAALIAARFMEPEGTLTLAHVFAYRGGDTTGTASTDRRDAGSIAALEELAVEIREITGCRVQTVWLGGDVAETLLRYARAEHCDTVALGGHDHGFVERAIFGSVRAKLLRAASTTVLIAPHANH